MNLVKLTGIILVILSISCQTKSKTEAPTNSAAEKVDSVALLTKRPSADAPRSAADRLVRALYFEHRKEDNPFREAKDRALVDQFFAKATADLIWKSQKSSKANMLFNAPDKTVEKPWVLPANVAGSKAVVFVTFVQQGKPVEMRCEMEQQAGRWRITDIIYPDGTRLTKLLG
ncbi:hypothetical protein ACFSUS_12800 [Spirosoma soli]|uniref:DUF3828 domain-containing protein n=1 Tax=Spirosoma soli TaxID=1770529 RepID=A0ABW5M3A0_9BACT